MKHIKPLFFIPSQIITIGFLIVFSGRVYALQSEYTAIRILKGLSFENTLAMIQDAHGFIWFGTLDGLNRYDGNEMRVYKHKPFDTTSLVQDFVNVIAKERRRKIWMGTAEGGLCIYDRQFDNFKQITKDEQKTKSIRDNRIRAITISEDGLVYVGHALGVDILDTNGLLVESIPLKTLEISLKPVHAIAIGGNNVLIGDESGLQIYFPATRTVKRISTPYSKAGASDPVLQIISYASENEWLISTRQNLYRFDSKNMTWAEIPIFLKPGLKFSYIKFIQKDDHNRWWIGSLTQGLCLVDSNFKVIDQWSMNMPESHKLTNNRVQGVLIDRDKNVWVSTAGGVHKLIRPFEGLHNIPLESVGPYTPTVRAFSRYHDGRILIGAIEERNSGLFWYSNDGTTSHIVPRQMPEGLITPIAVMSISEETGGGFWVGTMAQGLLKYDPITNILSRPLLQNRTIESQTIYSILIDREGNTWLGTNGEGVFRINKSNNQIKQFVELPADPSSLSGHIVRNIYQDYDGRIWLSSFDGGLNLFMGDSLGFKHFRHDPSNNSTLSSNLALCTAHDTLNKILWVGTRSGLNAMDLKTFAVRSYFTTDGLPNNIILGVLTYKQDVWISTYMGLSKYSHATKTFTSFYLDDGIMSEVFASGAFYNASEGVLLFGGTGYFLSVDATKPFVKQRAVSNLYINKISKIADSEQSWEPHTDKIDLWPDDIGVTIEYALVNQTSSRRNQYYYKLEGLSDKWISNDSKTHIAFTSLLPGDYRLVIRGQEVGVGLDPGESVIHISVHPPFWKTWWFRLLFLALILMLVRYLYNLRIQRFLALQKLRTQIASDLHDDIGSTLTKMALHADLALTRESASPHFEWLSQIGKMSRGVIESMSHIVWSIDARHDNLGDLIDHMRDHVYGLSASDEISYRFDTFIEHPQTIQMEPDYRHHIYLIFKEALNNVIKHARASRVNIEFRLEYKMFSMRITDNGCGGLNAKSDSGHGVYNMHRRAKAMKGELLITSMSGETSIKLRVPLEYGRFFNFFR